ncbi:MAG: putative transporter [Candidatus Fonsibacter sp.]|jgi:peptide/bleomycin uptake transporter|nr:putative transporter [Pseudomonadota bacterium]NCU44858.1 putative transporter [Candidatus Fonsibacter ubiquis]GBL33577.1 peptide antibiotic transporter SbmA [Pelagibacterales bacterium]NCU46075.1 putative transporter [Candidatus Fonsibacter ubiquis]NCU47566.1 putative transporter [Candidatus Fonsibacter ubiquis]
MFKSFFLNKRWVLWAWGGAILLILSLLIQVSITVKINEWYKGFYDLLQNAAKSNISEFWEKIYVFSYLAFPYVLLATFTSFFTRVFALRWREAITFDYLPFWKSSDASVEGASQRIQEDASRFAKIVESLGLQVVRAIMTLIAFIPILWGLSSGIEIEFLKQLPGSLVWVSLFVSLGGLLISWFVGIRLPGLEYNNQKVEASFRKELVYGEDDRIKYAKPDTVVELFSGIKFNYHRLFYNYGYFDIWVNLYDQFMVIVPYLVMAPSLFSGLITLGVIVQVSNAFQRVHNSFSLFIHQWTTITELRSIHKRLGEFEMAIGYKKN